MPAGGRVAGCQEGGALSAPPALGRALRPLRRRLTRLEARAHQEGEQGHHNGTCARNRGSGTPSRARGCAGGQVAAGGGGGAAACPLTTDDGPNRSVHAARLGSLLSQLQHLGQPQGPGGHGPASRPARAAQGQERRPGHGRAHKGAALGDHGATEMLRNASEARGGGCWTPVSHTGPSQQEFNFITPGLRIVLENILVCQRTYHVHVSAPMSRGGAMLPPQDAMQAREVPPAEQQQQQQRQAQREVVGFWLLGLLNNSGGRALQLGVAAAAAAPQLCQTPAPAPLPRCPRQATSSCWPAPRRSAPPRWAWCTWLPWRPPLPARPAGPFGTTSCRTAPACAPWPSSWPAATRLVGALAARLVCGAVRARRGQPRLPPHAAPPRRAQWRLRPRAPGSCWAWRLPRCRAAWARPPASRSPGARPARCAAALLTGVLLRRGTLGAHAPPR